MSTTAIAASNAYRHKVALAAAGTGAMPVAAFMAFGTGSAPYDLDNQALSAEFMRIPSINTVTGPQMTITGTLTGIQAGNRIVREVGVFANDGTLMGRRVLSPKSFEPEMQLEFEIVFQY